MKPSVSPCGSGMIQKQLGTAYDVVKEVRDNLDAIRDAAAIVNDELDHIKLVNRNSPNQHSINSISGLEAELAAKQQTLQSGVSIKTIGGQHLLGAGDVELIPENITGLSDLLDEVNNQLNTTTKIAGYFATGFEFKSSNQIGITPDGQWWSYNGSLPFTVPADTVPSEPNYTNRSDAALRSDLASASGASFVNGAVKELNSISDVNSASWLQVGDLVVVGNVQDGTHLRKVSAVDDGSGIPSGVLFANLIPVNGKIKLSELGITAGQDVTDIFNNKLPAYIVANNITAIENDVGDVKMVGVLDFAFSNVVFTGFGDILNTDTRNLLQKRKTQFSGVKQFSGPINSGVVFSEAFKTAALVKKEVRVVLFGDSISVGGDYDSFNNVPSGSVPTIGVDNADVHTSFSMQVYAQIVAAVPTGTRVRFYNRSIAGLGYGSIATAWNTIGGAFSGREQAVIGKTWRDCVLDLNPDLVIHALGMNETPASYINGFSSLWHDYIAGKQKLGTFDQAIVTTPNPNFQDATPYGDFRAYENNAAKFYTANLQRHVARLVGASLIDVSAYSFIKRYGFDPRSCVFSNDEESIVFTLTWGTQGVVQGSSVQRFTQIEKESSYKSIRLKLNSSIDSSTSLYDFRITIGDVLISIIPSTLRLYVKGVVSENSLIGLPSSNGAFSLSAGVDKDLVVTITPTGVFIYSGDKLVTSSNTPAYKATLGMSFQLLNVAGSVTVSDVYQRNGLHPRYSADTKTNGEMYGVVDWQVNPFGGGINHPSAVGITEIYTPPVSEWIKDAVNTTTVRSGILNGTLVNEFVQIGRLAAIDGNMVSIKIRGAFDFACRVDSGSGTGVSSVSHPAGSGVDVYIDPADLTVFIRNTNKSLYQVDVTGSWLSKRVIKLGGAASVRGGLSPLPNS